MLGSVTVVQANRQHIINNWRLLELRVAWTTKTVARWLDYFFTRRLINSVTRLPMLIYSHVYIINVLMSIFLFILLAWNEFFYFKGKMAETLEAKHQLISRNLQVIRLYTYLRARYSFTSVSRYSILSLHCSWRSYLLTLLTGFNSQIVCWPYIFNKT